MGAARTGNSYMHKRDDVVVTLSEQQQERRLFL